MLHYFPPDAEFIPNIGVKDLIQRDQDDLVIERPCLDIIRNSEVIEEVQIINGMVPGNITKALAGEHVGTIIFKQTSFKKSFHRVYFLIFLEAIWMQIDRCA